MTAGLEDKRVETGFSGNRQEAVELDNGHSYGGRLSQWGSGGCGDEPCGAAWLGLGVHPAI